MGVWAQHGEEEYMQANWDRLRFPKNGTFVEVGALDGYELSNTAWLEKVKGWGGICIEPDTRRFPILSENRNCICFDCAIGSVPTDEADFVLSAIGWSGFKPKNLHHEVIKVKVKTMDQVLVDTGINAIDVLSIDTEGTENDVWNSLDHKKYKPKLVIIEDNNETESIALLESAGYTLDKKLGANLMFIRGQDVNHSN